MQAEKRIELFNKKIKTKNGNIFLNFETPCCGGKAVLEANYYEKSGTWTITESESLEILEKYAVDPQYGVYEIREEFFDEEGYEEEQTIGMYFFLYAENVEKVKQFEKELLEEIKQIEENLIQKIKKEIEKIN